MAFLSGWSNRLKLTIDSTYIDSTLTNFPALIHLSNSCGTTVSGATGFDATMVFDELASNDNRKKIAVTTDDEETQCYVEIEKWDDVEEEASLWVKIPSISSTADTVLYLYYDLSQTNNTNYVGDTGDTVTQGVWDSSFDLVSHLSSLSDSTSNGNDGTSTGDIVSGFNTDLCELVSTSSDTISYGDFGSAESCSVEFIYKNTEDGQILQFDSDALSTVDIDSPNIYARMGQSGQMMLTTPINDTLYHNVHITKTPGAYGMRVDNIGCVWNEDDKQSGVTLSNGVEALHTGGAGWNVAGVRATASHSSGKYYFEILVDVGLSNIDITIGIGTAAASLEYAGYDDYSYGFYGANGNIYNNGANSYASGFTDDDIVGVAVDLDNNYIWFSVNGVWQANGNPNQTEYGFAITPGTYFPQVNTYQQNEKLIGRFSTENQTYPAPDGFVGWGDHVSFSDTVTITEPVWNENDKQSGITVISGTTIKHEGGASTWQQIRAEQPLSSGKHYFEVYIDNINASRNFMTGIGTADMSLSMLGDDAYGYGYYAYNGFGWNNNSGSVDLLETYDDGDIIGVAVDLDSNKLWWSRNGSWLASGDPENGTNPAFNITDGIYYASVSAYEPNDQITARFEASDLTYTTPSGFVAGFDQTGNTAMDLEFGGIDCLIDEVRVSTTDRTDAWFKASYYSSFGELFSFTSEIDNSAWDHRLKITIPSNLIDTTLTDFPVLLNISSTGGITGSDMTCVFDELTSDANRKKIAVTTDDEQTQCYVEISHWSDTNEQAYLWVKVPEISSSSDTVLYLYYDVNQTDNTSYVGDVADEAAQQVWSNDYVAVYHMSEDPTGGTGCIKDSTEHENHGTPVGAWSSNDLVDGVIHKCLDFTEGPTIDCGNDLSLNENINLTLEAIINYDDQGESSSGRIVGKAASDNTNGWQWLVGGTATIIVTGDFASTGQWDTSNNSVSASTDYYVATTYDQTLYTNDPITYVNASLVSNASDVNPSAGPREPDSGYNMYIGSRNNADRQWDGRIEEVRVSRVIRSAGWINTTYLSNWDNLVIFERDQATQWLEGWANRIKLTIDKDKIDETLYDFPVNLTLSSGTGITNTDVSDMFLQLATTNSGSVDSYTEVLLNHIGDESDSQHSVNYPNRGIINSSVYPTNYYGSYKFDGTNDWITIDDSDDFYFGTDDFTIDFKIMFNTDTSDQALIGQYVDVNNYWEVFKYSGTNSGYLSFVFKTTGTTRGNYRFTWDPDPSTWYRITCVRSSTIAYIFIDGVSQTLEEVTAFSTNDVGNLASPLYIGGRHTGTQYLSNCYITNIHVAKGIARWTSGFTPSAYPTEADSYTKLLLNCRGDASASEHSIAYYDGAKTVMSEHPTGFTSSDYYDGTDDLATISHNASLNLGSDPFTIDFWINGAPNPDDYITPVGKKERWDTTYPGWIFGNDSSGSHDMIFQMGDNSTSLRAVSTSTVFNNVWHHVAAVCNSDWIVKLFIDGVLEDSIDMSSLKGNCDNTRKIGFGRGEDYASYRYICECYLSNFRFSPGIERWTNDFIPPTGPYPEYTDILDQNEKRIAITTSDGTSQCYAEVSSWEAKTKQENRKAIVWTKVPVISNSEDTILYLYYDKTQQDNTNYVGVTGDTVVYNVWDDYFKGVWHLEQYPINSTACILNSATNSYHGTPSGYDVAADELVDGKVGKATTTDSTNKIHCGTTLDVSSLTLEQIVKVTGGAGQSWVQKGQIGAAGLDWGIQCDSTNVYLWANTTSNAYGKAGGLTAGVFNYVAATLIGNTANMFIDGVEITAPIYEVGTMAISDNNYPFHIGRWNSQSIEGNVIDEVRVSDTIRSDAWIKATYYSNWNTLITFDTIAAQPTHYYEGYVTENTLPVARTVRLYRRSNGELVDTTTSRSYDGYYYLTTIYNEDHFIVAFDDELYDVYNAKVLDRLTPTGIA